MGDEAPVALIGRENELKRFDDFRRRFRYQDTGCLWVTGDAGCGKSRFLQACAERAKRAGWEVLAGRCTEETRTDPYGPFLSMLGLCFDKGGRLINDRSVYSIVDQISLDDVFEAVSDIPGMAAVALGIKVGMSIFDSRRRPKAEDDLQNRNFEFILQILKQIGTKRSKPLLLVLDDLHQASATTSALIEYVLTRIQDTRLLVVSTWQAESAEDGWASIRKMSSRLAQPDHVLYLSPLPDEKMRLLLGRFDTHLTDSLASAMIEFSRGMPGVLVQSLRLVEFDESHLDETRGVDATDSVIQTLIARQWARLSAGQRALLECASLIGQRVPLDVITAPPLCAYLGFAERTILSHIVELADQGMLLVWDGDDAVRFSSFVRSFLREGKSLRRVTDSARAWTERPHRARSPVVWRDHVRIAESWQAVSGTLYPARLAMHYLAGREAKSALLFALQSAEELYRSAAYPESVQSYRLALEAWEQMPESDEQWDLYDILRAMSLAAEQAGDWGEAVAQLQKALSLSDENAARQAEIYAGLGWLHFQRGGVQTALEHLNRSAALYASLSEVQGCAQVDYYLGVLYSQQKEWQRAISCFERYLDVSQEHGFDEGRASAYLELGNLYRVQRHWPQAESFLQRGIDLACAEEDYTVLAQGYHYLGSCYALQGKPESIDVLNQALDIVHVRTKQPAQEARIQNTLAEAYVRLNHWAKAEAAFHASAKIKERLDDRAGLAMTYGGLGRFYFRQWRFNLAAQYAQKDLDLLGEEPDANVAWIQQLTNLVGEVRRLQGQLGEAARHFSAALALAERIPDERVRKQSQGYTHLLLARLSMDRGDFYLAEKECTAALTSLVGTWADGEAHRTAACLARLRGDITHGRAYLDRALAAAEQGEDLERALAQLEKAHYARDMGDVEEMGKSLDRVVVLAQRLQNVELESRANQMLRSMQTMR
jgi:tetratricopeptide (TPR) repeat protein